MHTVFFFFFAVSENAILNNSLERSYRRGTNLEEFQKKREEERKKREEEDRRREEERRKRYCYCDFISQVSFACRRSTATRR